MPYSKVSSNIIRRQTKKFTPDDGYINQILESLEGFQIIKGRKISTHRTYPPYVAPPESNMGTLIICKVN